MIDRMLGGSGDSGPPMRRPLTEIEQRLAARVVGTLLTSLERTTRGDAPLTSRLQRVESDPRRLDAMPSDAAILLVTFEVVLGASRGTIDVALPTSLVERLDGIRPGTSEVVVYLAETKMPVDQARNLVVGDVITTNQSADAPLTARVDGRSAMQVRAGSVNGRKAIRVA
jgi:flagellar motor switch protein FliM